MSQVGKAERIESRPHVLVVDDDERLRDLLERYLSGHGFRVHSARDADEAAAFLSYVVFDALVVDVMMPRITGTDFVKSLRARKNGTPVLMLTALGETPHRITGLKSGADDYLGKPFEPEELLLRLQKLIGRKTEIATRDATVRFGARQFDLQRLELRAGKERVRLSSAEAQLLKTLVQNSGQLLSRTALLKLCDLEGNERTIDVQITRLRRKIEPDARLPRYLHTVRGKGYVLHLDPAEQDGRA